MLFPAGAGDWYKSKKYGTATESPSRDFCNKQKSDPTAYYHGAFDGLNISVEMISAQLSNGGHCALESFICAPEEENTDLPGNGKHIIYFPGADTYYQACFRDISMAAKETGATVHAFNFPGTGLSTGQVREANDLTNAGIAMVKSLLKQGIHPDDIVLQGDCFGAAIAMEVKEQLRKQAKVDMRIIMNNSFKSFKAAVQDMISSTAWLPDILKSIIKRLLQFTGWHITPGKKFVHSGPHQCHIRHDGDLVLPSGTLSEKVRRMRASDKDKYKDTCPDDYKAARAKLDAGHVLPVREDAKNRLGKKFGRDQYGRINAHFADLCELETQDGQPAYSGFVNEFLSASNTYIEAHPQTVDITALENELEFIDSAASIEITEKEAAQMQEFKDVMDAHPFVNEAEAEDEMSHDSDAAPSEGDFSPV
jgi:hypothetical protein